MGKAECALCRSRRRDFCCAQCTSDMLQQRRTMLAALRADVAVLRKKSAFALHTKSPLLEADRRLDERMQRVEALTDRVMKARERLCSERIALVERSSALEERSQAAVETQQKLESERRRSQHWHQPLLESLDFQVQWALENAAKARGEKIRELFAFFTLTPEQSEDHADADEAEAAFPTPLAPAVAEKTPRRQTVRRPPPLFRSITGIPLPISGRYGNMPPEVAAAAMGKIIHLLQCLVKYLKVTYPHPMVFNGSFSTIGNTSEGAGCHTLYPDGSPGFARAVEMLHENVSFLCSTQGVAPSALHPTDILGNLLVMYQSTRLGTLCDGAVVSSPAKRSSASSATASTSQLELSQALNDSIQILPHYS